MHAEGDFGEAEEEVGGEVLCEGGSGRDRVEGSGERERWSATRLRDAFFRLSYR